VTIAVALGLCLVGLALVIWSAERLVEGVVGTSLGFGVSAFVVSVVFVGFDPENLAVGAVGAVQGLPGIAAGSVIGAAMVAVGLAFGVTALLAPMRFARAPGASS
jgi:cation:H+ antiporter